MNGVCECKTMDEISNEKIVEEKKRKISSGLYVSGPSAPWLILSTNNNNIDDSKLSTSLSTQNMEKEETCCNYLSMQMNKNSRDQLQLQHNKGVDKVYIDETPDGDDANKEEKVNANDKENSFKTKDNEAGTDDDNNNDNNNNSFENISYIDEDEKLGVIDDIILLPNNLYSEDEMSNSDDCIYAYRGVDFEPTRSSPEDENDFLEMDFEPDPSSEIEQDSRSLTQRSHWGENMVARESNLPNRLEPDLASDDVEIKPSIACILVDTPSIKDKYIDNAVDGDDACAFENHTESSTCRLNTALQNFAEESNEKTDGVGENSQSVLSNTVVSAPPAMKKYTGTIPKTNRNYLNLRLTRPKVLGTNFGSSKKYRDIKHKNYPAYMCKRWKNANSVPEAVTYLQCDESQNASDILRACEDPTKAKSNTERSMSFPFEGSIQSEEGSYNDRQVVPKSNLIRAKLQSSQQQNQVFKRDKHEANDMNWSGNCHGNGYNASVSIFTSNCDIDVISAALAELNIRVNLRKLTTSLSHIADIELMQLSISEYLIHMSKLNCDYKAIKNAIISSHDDLDLDIVFIPADQDHFEVINIPVKEILLRLGQNSKLFDILSIRNRRFQRSNVLGQVVNAIRKFRTKNLDSLKEVNITVPKYYQSGYLSIIRK